MASHFITAMNQLYRPYATALATTKNMKTPNRIFFKKGLHISQLNVNSLLTKIDEIRSIAKQSNGSIIGISESKLHSCILNSEVDIMGYNIIKMDPSRRGCGIACYIKRS